ncbi:hypothetical protein MHIB_12700 [Mycolicibacter hiberniae]|uniref:Uncharacterized protein n=1 Tax=Mycolicibacter hiberniae TaxID=29314 RepID=A0A7I7X0C5_9MYCO|nr:hypothetical protein MHIB_12700 [Mycolicibacter hiberniae]
MTGDMLASSDKPAAIPTAQAAAVGTQWSRDGARLRERGTGGTVKVIASENRQTNRKYGVRRDRSAGSVGTTRAELLLDSPVRPSRRKPGQQVEFPPTTGRRGLVVRSQAVRTACSAHSAGGLMLFRP